MSEHDDRNSISRRNLLVGSVGATVGGMVAATPALAQHAANGIDPQTVSSHTVQAGSLSNRIYSVNPSHPDMADIAENPVNVPPAITRREPATVRVDLETKEVEAHLDEKAMFRFWTFNGTVPGPFI